MSLLHLVLQSSKSRATQKRQFIKVISFMNCSFDPVNTDFFRFISIDSKEEEEHNLTVNLRKSILLAGQFIKMMLGKQAYSTHL